jgi:DsbC/DsbD-like thiol-disulfide interchange protein
MWMGLAVVKGYKSPATALAYRLPRGESMVTWLNVDLGIGICGRICLPSRFASDVMNKIKAHVAFFGNF